MEHQCLPGDDSIHSINLKAREEDLKTINDDLGLQLAKVQYKKSKEQSEGILSKKKTDPTSRKRQTYDIQTKERRDGTNMADNQICFEDESLHSIQIEEAEGKNIENLSVEKENIDWKNIRAEDRILKAKIRALSVQLKEAIRSKNDVEHENVILKEKLKESLDHAMKVEKVLYNTDAKSDRQLKSEKYTKNTIDDLRHENQSLKRQISSQDKIIEKADKESRDRELILSRTLEEIGRYKHSIVTSSANQKEKELGVESEKKDLQKRIYVLEKQKNNVLFAFKKQLKLIDVLKRQKVHAEASKLLQITEEEFMKVIDSGDEN